jgi:hypothetical protein
MIAVSASPNVECRARTNQAIMVNKEIGFGQATAPRCFRTNVPLLRTSGQSRQPPPSVPHGGGGVNSRDVATLSVSSRAVTSMCSEISEGCGSVGHLTTKGSRHGVLNLTLTICRLTQLSGNTNNNRATPYRFARATPSFRPAPDRAA